MSDSLRPDDPFARIAEVIKNPYLQLPVAWVPAVFDFWSYYAHLLKGEGELALCTRVRWLMLNDNLTLPELEKAFSRVRMPTVSAQYQFASQVLAGVAEQIEEIRRTARAKERQESQRKEYAAPEAIEVVSNLAEAFRSKTAPAIKEVQ